MVAEMGPDEVGEICIANPGVFPGSTYTESDKNLNLFHYDIYLRTGDLGRIDADGYIWITGRAKDLIIRGGHNIDPAVIEEAPMTHPSVAFAGAIGQPDAHAGEVPAVYVELIEGREARLSLMGFSAAHACTWRRARLTSLRPVTSRHNCSSSFSMSAKRSRAS